MSLTIMTILTVFHILILVGTPKKNHFLCESTY